MKYNITLFFIFLSLSAQQKSSEHKSYNFIIVDSPAVLFTMRQINQDYLSGYRLFAKTTTSLVKNKNLANMIQAGFQLLLFLPTTHEEGHRSVLTVHNIGSISQPFFNMQGAAYVKGVHDETLKKLRDTNLPTFIRLHTAGIESDYMLTKRVETIASFEEDEFNNLKWEYWGRKYAIIQYFVMGLFNYEVGMKEETDELERDIVGHDIYGAVRHLCRPNMNFYRYTDYNDLTEEEKHLVHRFGYRSLLNFLNPLIIGKANYRLNKNTRFNFGLGYALSPFGDFIDENVWIKNNRFNLYFYVRQYQNKHNWFHAFGIGLYNFQISKKWQIDMIGHFWQQPLNFNFNTDKYFTGAAFDGNAKYWFYDSQNVLMKKVGLNFGFLYKTNGFLPEELYLKEHLGIRLGLSFLLK